jgi:hypothetical protein
MSSASDRLSVIYTAYKTAYGRRASDLKHAASAEEAQGILDIVEGFERAYLKAARQALDGNGAEVEAAYQAAKDACKKVDEAYQGARSTADKIRAGSAAVAAVTGLVKKACVRA